MLYELRNTAGQVIAGPFVLPAELQGLTDTELRQQHRIYPTTLTPTEQQLAQARAEKITQLKRWREAMQNGTVEHTVGGTARRFQMDERSRGLLDSAITVFSAGVPVPPGFFWTDADNNDVPMTLADLVALAGAMADRVQRAHATYRALRQQVEQSTDLEAITGITPPATL